MTETFISPGGVKIRPQPKGLLITKPNPVRQLHLHEDEKRALETYYAAKFISLLDAHYDQAMANDPDPYLEGAGGDPNFAYARGFVEGIADSADVIRIKTGLDEV